jgi:uncharacterized protein YbjT (DUF2867 family)
MSNPTTFVCGATGTQGGALASNLLSQGLPVRCLARNPSSPAAQSLKSRGAQVFTGSYDDTEVLTEAITGCTTVYMNFMPDFTDLTAELRWAQSILKIAGEKDVKHVMCSSGFGMEDPLSLPGIKEGSVAQVLMSMKKSIENELRAAKHVQKWTLLRPGWFMANLLNPFAERMCPTLVSPAGTWTVAFTPSTRLPMIDTITMGNFTTAAVLNPDKFHGKIVTYCDELLSLEEIVDRVAKATGRKELKVEYMKEEDIQAQYQVNPFLQGQYIARGMGEMVNMEEVKKWGVELSSLETFLEREKARVAETYGVKA